LGIWEIPRVLHEGIQWLQVRIWKPELLPVTIVWLVARVFFFPSLAYNLFRNFLQPELLPWYNRIDDTVIVGAFPFKQHILAMKAKENMQGIINCCEEYEGPIALYQQEGLQQLRLPIIDYIAPTLDQIHQAMAFIKKVQTNGILCLHTLQSRPRAFCHHCSLLVDRIPTLEPRRSPETVD